MWRRAYKDAKRFKQTRIAIIQAEIGKILAFGGADGIEKSGVLYAAGFP